MVQFKEFRFSSFPFVCLLSFFASFSHEIIFNLPFHGFQMYSNVYAPQSQDVVASTDRRSVEKAKKR